MEVALKKDLKLIVDNEELEPLSPADKAAAKEELQRWPLFGLSVGSFLQVINMEQQTCLLDVYRSSNQLGYFCIVEGTLFNAICGDREGEDAAMEMISWENVRLNIKQILNTSGIKRKIGKNLMSLLMEGSRRRDEAEDNNHKQGIIKKAKDTEKKVLPSRDNERAKLDACLKIMTDGMGDALISASIISISDSKVMESYRNKPESAVIYKRLTDSFRDAFTESLLGGGLGGHYILDLKGKRTLVVLILGDYHWSIVFNNAKCSLGLFLNIIMPEVVKTFNEMNL